MSNTDRFKKGLVSGGADHWMVPIASGGLVEVGDLLVLTSGKAVRMATTTENLTFIGPAHSAHTALNGSGTIQVGKPNGIDVYEYDLDAATDITLGDLLQRNGAQVLKKSTTDAIAMAVESKLQATKVNVVFLIPAKTAGPRAVGDAS